MAEPRRAVRVAPTLTVVPALYGRDHRATGAAAPVAMASGDAGHRSSTRNAAVMAAGTTLSRLSGFARVLAIGWVFGQDRLSDAYNQANTLPNIVYELLLGGVLSATLLPVIMQAVAKRALDRDDEGVSAIVTFLAVLLLAGTGVFWLAAPLLMHLYLALATGPGVPGERALATSWLRLFTPQLLFIGLTAICNALLNARRRFASVAFSPVLANGVTIAALVVADHIVRHASVANYRADTTAVMVVGLGTTAGYALQLLAQLPALARCGISLRPVWRPSHPALATIARLSGWTVGVVVTNQISYTVDAVLANSKRGNLSAFTYAYTFMQLPYAVVAVSIAYAVAPDLAQLWSAGNRQAFAKRAGYALRFVLVLLLPGGIGYALLAHPVALIALAHGQLHATSADLTGSLLAIFALGLPGFSAYLLVMRAFQAKQDTRSMFWLYVVENGLTVVAALCLYPLIGVRGLAAAWIGSYTVVLPLAWRKLRQSAPVTVAGGWLSRVVLATGVMAVVVAAAVAVVPEPSSVVLAAARLLLLTAVGAVAFVVAGRAFGLPELDGLVARARALAR